MKPSHKAGPSPHADVNNTAMNMELSNESIIAGEELGKVFPSDVLGEVLKLHADAPQTVIPILFLLGMKLVIGR